MVSGVRVESTADDEIVVLGAQLVGHVEGERREAAFMLADDLAIEIDRGAIIGRAEAQEDALACRSAGASKLF